MRGPARRSEGMPMLPLLLLSSLSLVVGLLMMHST